jgi:hypothetical protein
MGNTILAIPVFSPITTLQVVWGKSVGSAGVIDRINYDVRTSYSPMIDRYFGVFMSSLVVSWAGFHHDKVLERLG